MRQESGRTGAGRPRPRARRRLAAGAAAVWGLLAAGPLGAQIGLGAQASSGDNSGFGIGPRLVFDLGPFDAGFRLVGSFDLYFPGDDFEHDGVSLRDLEEQGTSTEGLDQDYWEINANVHYTLGLPIVPLTPYLGGGVVFAHTERTGSAEGFEPVDETETGANLLAGIGLDVAGITLFVELKLEVLAGDQWVTTGGIVF